MDYIQGKSADSDFTEKVEKAVEEAREHREWRLDYMSLMEKLRDEREEGREESRNAILNALIKKGIFTELQAQQFAAQLSYEENTVPQV